MLLQGNKNEVLNPESLYDINVGELSISQLEVLHSCDFLCMIFCKELFWKLVYRYDDLIKFLDASVKRYIPLNYDDRVMWYKYIQKTLVSIMTPKRKKRFIQENIEKTILSFKKDLVELNSKRGKYQSLMLDTLMSMHSYKGRLEENVFGFDSWFTNKLKNVADKYGIKYRRIDNLALLDALFWGVNEKNVRDIMDAITGLHTGKTWDEQTNTAHQKTYQSQSDEVKKALAFMGLDESFSKTMLKKRYRVLAKKYHPDVSHQNAKMFQKLGEANTLLEAYLEKKN